MSASFFEEEKNPQVPYFLKVDVCICNLIIQPIEKDILIL